jgi:hypothetical protein
MLLLGNDYLNLNVHVENRPSMLDVASHIPDVPSELLIKVRCV